MRETLNFENGILKVLERLNSFKDRVNLIGVAGETGSGKTYFCDRLVQNLGGIENAEILSIDNYYFSKEQRKSKNGEKYNDFDNPLNSELELLAEHLFELRQGNQIQRPCYDFKRSERFGKKPVIPKRFIFVEGLWALDKRFLDFYKLKIYIKADKEIRFNRRLRRDIERRKIPEYIIRRRFLNEAEPNAKLYVVPTMEYADLIIDNAILKKL